MKGLLAQLSPNEEVALRRVALGIGDGVARHHVRRLHSLDLIDGEGPLCQLTLLGRQRFEALPRPQKWVGDGTPEEVAAILSRFTTRGDKL